LIYDRTDSTSTNTNQSTDTYLKMGVDTNQMTVGGEIMQEPWNCTIYFLDDKHLIATESPTNISKEE